MTLRAKLSGCRPAFPAVVLFALALSGLRFVSPSLSTRPLRRGALDAWIRVGEPVDERGEGWQPPRVLPASAVTERSLPALQHLATVVVAHPAAPPRRIVRRLKLPPAGDDAVPPH